MKRLCAFCVCLLFLSLCGCGTAAPALLKVGGVSIPQGVCVYEMDRVLADPGSFGADESDASSLQNAALSLCREYAAAEQLFAQENLTLSIAQKSGVASRARGLWQIFGGTYRRLGIRKADLTAVLENEAKVCRLVQWEYGAGGKNEVSQKELLRLFHARYVIAQVCSISLTDLSDAETAAQKQSFEAMAKQVNAGKSIGKVYAAYCSERGLLTAQTPQTQIWKLDDPAADPALLKALQNTGALKAVSVQGETKLFLAQRMENAAASDEAFLTRSDQILEEEKLPEMQKKIALLAQKNGAEQDERQWRALLETVRRAREEAN